MYKRSIINEWIIYLNIIRDSFFKYFIIFMHRTNYFKNIIDYILIQLILVNILLIFLFLLKYDK